MSLSPHHGAGVRHPHFKEWYKMVKKICLMLVIDITENLHALKDCIFQELGLLFFSIITCESNKHKWPEQEWCFIIAEIIPEIALDQT